MRNFFARPDGRTSGIKDAQPFADLAVEKAPLRLPEQLMPKTLFILNDAPYGTERSYNALRLAGALSRREGEAVRVFLMGDAASCAKKGQKVPQGYYNTELMLHQVARRGGEVGVCATCMDARGLADTELTDTTRRSSLEELTTWVQWADRTLVF